LSNPEPAPAIAPGIVTAGLSKRYGARLAVADLSISVPRGVVCGFVGPNGSGKTTTIRMLLGLVRPTSGSAQILGLPLSHPRAFLPRVGALIEGPAFYPTLSGTENLRVLAKLGGYSRKRIPELIAQVGLAGREGDRVGGYSLGMKQRLGIAAALLPDPELLLLDEPANGLDPPGIIEMRDLMRSLRDQGKTIFVSSHLLGELEQVADWLVVLKDGEALYCGPTKEMVGARHGGLMVRAERDDQLEAVAGIAAKAGHTVTRDDGRLHIGANSDYAATLNRECMNAGITLIELHHVQATLEESFFSLIGGAS
jgi:ABC-2 type transport system ATP-binding protein